MVPVTFKVQGILQLVWSVDAINVVGVQAVLTLVLLETGPVPIAAAASSMLATVLHGENSPSEATVCTYAHIASSYLQRRVSSLKPARW